jgi:hypothetical protein
MNDKYKGKCDKYNITRIIYITDIKLKQKLNQFIIPHVIKKLNNLILNYIRDTK